MAGFSTVVVWTVAGVLPADPASPPDVELRDYVPQPGVFPPPGVGIDIAGELIAFDPTTRSGILRRDGDFVDRDVLFRFALLPYAEVYHHGSAAEVQDVPLGTRLHGRFLLPPEDGVARPTLNLPSSVNIHSLNLSVASGKDTPRHSHAVILEDDFSHAARRGAAWKITAVDLAKIGELAHQKGVLSCESTVVGPNGEPEIMEIEVSRATRIWKAGGGIGELEELEAGQGVLMNLGWAPAWKHRRFHCIDLWIDGESQKAATERQRRVHVRKTTYFWPAAWIDEVEHQPGGKGILTITLFGGMDKVVEDALRWMNSNQWAPVFVAAADGNLMTWWQDHDKAGGPVLEVRNIPDPPLGHSGLQIRVQIQGPLLEGFRPGRFVRVKPHLHWPGATPPLERRPRWDPLAADAGYLLDGRPAFPADAESPPQVTPGVAK